MNDEIITTPRPTSLRQSPLAVVKVETSGVPQTPPHQLQRPSPNFSNNSQMKSSPQSFMHPNALKEESPSPNGNSRDTSEGDVFVDQDDIHRHEHPTAEIDTEFIEELSRSNNDDSDYEPESDVSEAPGFQNDLESEPNSPNVTPKPKANRRSAAKNPREYFKRKQDDNLKKQNTTKRKSSKQSAKEMEMEKDVLQSLIAYNHIAPNEAQQNGPIPEFASKTKQDQMSKLLANSVADMKNNKMSIRELSEAFTSFGLGNMKAENGKWLHKKMDTALFHYQMVGVSKMLERECSTGGAPGGILADAMGLGKTVETNALIVSNPPAANIPKDERTTLIIVPPSVLFQWKVEIQKHAGKTIDKDRVIIYKASENPNRRHLIDAEIVLTTHHELVKSCPPFPDKEQIAELKEHHEDLNVAIENWIANSMEDAGLLHKHKWYRVVIDEAHAMKNHKKKLSHAANALEAHYRWTLSGTPVMNRVDEFFSMFRFLKDPGTGSFAAFKISFCNPKDEGCTQRLVQALSELMIRSRTMQDTFLGYPLVQLPRTHTHVIEIKFTAQERILYRAVEEKFRELINEELAEDDPLRNLTFFIVQLGRLRQLSSHPALVERIIKDVFEVQELLELREKLQLVGCEIANRIPSWIKRKREDAEKAEAKAALREHPVCAICMDIAEDPHMIDLPNCKHVFCETCIKDHAETSVAEGAEVARCYECKAPFDASKLKSLNFPSLESNATVAALYRQLRKGKDSLKFIPETLPSAWLNMIDAGKANFFESAKLRASVKQLETWLQDKPDDKIIIFVQWRQLATLIGRKLEDRKIGFLYYTGDMSASKRETAVQKFRERSDLKIMIAGLKCGGVGLNLAFANRVVSLDLWWNLCIENQAFGRVYRLGQEKETYFERVVVRKSVDARLLELQAKKSKEIGKAMGDKLTKEEWAGLFGKAVKDEKGNVISVADYDDDSDDDIDEWD